MTWAQNTFHEESSCSEWPDFHVWWEGMRSWFGAFRLFLTFANCAGHLFRTNRFGLLFANFEPGRYRIFSGTSFIPIPCVGSFTMTPFQNLVPLTGSHGHTLRTGAVMLLELRAEPSNDVDVDGLTADFLLRGLLLP